MLRNLNATEMRVGRYLRAVLSVTICIAIGGCASAQYQHAGLPVGEENEGTVRAVTVGANVRVTLNDERVVFGEVFSVSEGELVINPSHEYGVGLVTVLKNEINFIEMQYAEAGERALVFTVIGVVAGVLYLLASSIGGIAGN